MDNWYVTVEDMERLRQHGRRLYIVDIRERDRYRQGHIRGAVNMQTNEEDNLSPYNEQILARYANSGYIIILYCSTGISALRCVRKLRRNNIRAYNLYGGIKEYSKSN